MLRRIFLLILEIDPSHAGHHARNRSPDAVILISHSAQH